MFDTRLCVSLGFESFTPSSSDIEVNEIPPGSRFQHRPVTANQSIVTSKTYTSMVLLSPFFSTPLVVVCVVVCGRRCRVRVVVRRQDRVRRKRYQT